jgi:two-component system, cell cycle sensor histidine kinase and response regulator CckA
MRARLYDSSLVNTAQQALDLLASILESSTEYSIIGEDLDGKILLWSEGARRLYGYEAEEVVGRANSSILHTPEDVAAGKPRELLDAALREAVWEGTVERCRKNRQQFTARVVITPRKDPIGKPIGFLVISSDISDQVRLSEQLSATQLCTEIEVAERKRAEDRFRVLVETAPQGIIITDHKGRIVDANPQALQLFGYERAELIGQTVEALLPSSLRQGHERERRAFNSNPHARPMGVGMDLRAHRKNGTEFPVEISLVPLVTHSETLVSAVIVDITERKKMEEQLRGAQRLEAIGRLAGGVAHDFNNLLTVILGCCDALLDELPASHPALRKVATMRKAGFSAADLTRQLLAFGRKQVLHPRVLEPAEIISDVESMLRRLIGEDVQLLIHIDPEVGPVNADPVQIEQVLINLAANARDAMPKGGRLSIEVSNIDLDEQYRMHHPTATPGPYVMFTVADSGCGMDPSTQARIFDPFFTTKELGKGTGLGLATVYGIVKQSGGHIWVYSESDKGSVFKIYLPRVDRRVRGALPADPDGAPRGGNETILLVEDSKSLREIAYEYLKSLGYTVLEAGGGAEALQRFSEFGGIVDLLLTDIIMPEMNGRELADEIVRRQPSIKILFTSGYADDTIARHGVLETGVAFIQKPYRPRALAWKVREVLGQPAVRNSNVAARSAEESPRRA